MMARLNRAFLPGSISWKELQDELKLLKCIKKKKFKN